MLQSNDYFVALGDEHCHWLSSFADQYLRNWEKVRAANYEAAMTEAAIRRMLQVHGIAVEPNEKLSSNCGGPDFRWPASVGYQPRVS